MGRLAADEIQTRFPECGATQLGASLAEQKYHVARVPCMAGNRAISARQQPNHSDDRCWIDGAGWALIVERDVASRHRCVERTTRVRDAAACLAKLIKHLWPLGIAEVEAVGDAERPSAGTRDAAGGIGDCRLCAFGRVDAAEPAASVPSAPTVAG